MRVDAPRHFGNDDILPVSVVLYVHPAAQSKFAFAGTVYVEYILSAYHKSPRRKIGSLDITHELFELDMRVVEHRHATVYHFGKIMRRDIGCYTYRYTHGAVDEDIRESSRQKVGLLQRVVEILIPLNGILVDIAKELHRERAHFHFRITHGGGRVGKSTEVALPVDERHTHTEVLRHSSHSVVYGRVAVRMIFTHAIADDTRRLLETAFRFHVEVVHSVQYPALNGLQSVLHSR